MATKRNFLAVNVITALTLCTGFGNEIGQTFRPSQAGSTNLRAQVHTSNRSLLEGNGQKTIIIDIKKNGDCRRDETIQFSLKDYSKYKRAFPNSYYFLQRYSSLQADFEIDEHLSEYIDATSSVHLNFRMLGFAKTLGRSRWAIPVDENQVFVTKSIDPEMNREIYHFTTPHEQYRHLSLTVQSKYILPIEAANSIWNSSKRQLEYEIPGAYPIDGANLQMMNFYAKDRIVTASYKTYGLGKGIAKFMAAQWIGKAVFKNVGTGVLKDLKVRFKVTGYSEWSPWQTTREVFPNQTVVLTYYPVLNSSVASLQADSPADVICQYTYGDHSFDESQRVRLLGKNSFIFSYLLAGERFGTWEEEYANAPFLSAWVSRNDPVINMFSAFANKAAGGIGAGGSDNAAQQVLAKCYDLMVVNDITYQHPHYLQDNSISFDPRNVQNIKFPRDVLRDHSGTCVDLAILYASMANAIGLKAYLMLIPGHCFPIVELPTGAHFPVETTMVMGGLRFGVGSFDDAYRVGRKAYDKALQDGLYYKVDFQEWWQKGISNPELERLPEDILRKWNLRPILAEIDSGTTKNITVQNQDSLTVAVAVPKTAERQETISLRAGTAIQDVRVNAANRIQERGWTLVEQTETMLVLEMNRRRWEAKLYVTFSPNEVVIYSDSYAIGRRGKVRKHPSRWIANVKKDIMVAAGF